jgi:predicted unusual protein kinase regulating ubiquinone biosynthesis (AarF/ABC1/UbiB family)
MDWMSGQHLKEFLQTDPSQEVRNRIGQALWDFYDFQIHQLKAVHADPHPGNFLMEADGTLGIIDFGCVKEIPADFYENYFVVVNPHILQNEAKLEEVFYKMEFLYQEDTPALRKFYTDIFKQMIDLLTRPFRTETFDFSDDVYFKEIYEFGDSLANMKELRESKQARGSKHSLYINRTYFGLYSMLNDLRATVRTTRPAWLNAPL